MKETKNLKKDINEFLNGFKNMFNDLKTKGRRKKQVPNLITLSRIGIAAFIPPLAISGNLIGAGILTVLAAVTDGIDGFVARKLDAVSEFGKNLDPVCDKLFAGLLLIPLISSISPIVSLGIGLNLVLEAGIAGVNLNSKAKGNIPRTTILGKVKTGLLSILMASIYASFTYSSLIAIIPTVYLLTTITQSIALVDYYKIDKRKDKIKSKLEVFDTFEKEATNELENNIEKVNSKEEKKLTSDDYKKLREEVIRTYTKPIENIEFQKTK